MTLVKCRFAEVVGQEQGDVERLYRPTRDLLVDQEEQRLSTAIRWGGSGFYGSAPGPVPASRTPMTTVAVDGSHLQAGGRFMTGPVGHVARLEEDLDFQARRSLWTPRSGAGTTAYADMMHREARPPWRWPPRRAVSHPQAFPSIRNSE